MKCYQCESVANTSVANYQYGDAYEGITSFSERLKVAHLEERFREIAGAPRGTKTAVMALVARQEGIPFKTVERKFGEWRRHGACAIADKRKFLRADAATSAERVFFADFKRYAARDLNTSAGGYNAMLRDMRMGKAFSFGTWRDLWAREFPLEAVPAVCPANWTPRGFTYQNMMRLLSADPNWAMQKAWSRQGQFAASAYMLPVIRSRVGLEVGQVYQADDVWHNIDVYAAGIKGTFQPLEFAIYDVASAYKAGSLIKPRMLTVDKATGKETRDNLKEQQFRFLLAHLVCTTGFHKSGVNFILERGTTAIRENVQRQVKSIPYFGKLFNFSTSGILNTPAHKGMFIGNAGGNPRMKSLCECAHNILHNATAFLPGNRGRDAAHIHESRNAAVKYSEKQIELASRIDPVLVEKLCLPILEFKNYLQYFQIIEAEVMDRHEHSLEGWADRETLEYRLSETSDEWRAVEELADMPPERAKAVHAVVATNPGALMRKRKMSRREVWKAGQKNLVKLPLIYMPAFLDPRDMKEATVRPDGTIVFKDAVYFPGEKRHYIAVYKDLNGISRRLTPGEKVHFYFNPMGTLANHIWIATADGEVLGIAEALKTAAWADAHSIEVAMGQKQAQIAEVMGEFRASHVEDAAMFEAREEYNKQLLQAAKDGLQVSGVSGQVSVNEELEGEDPIQFLERMNSMAAH